VAVGGGAGDRTNKYGTNFVGTPGDDGTLNQDLKRVELLKPGVDTSWRLGPAQQKFRAYHSTEILLPDGRILSAGDDYWYLGNEERPTAPHAGESMDVGEIYSPPYLFDGDQLAPRPVIDDAPTEVPYGAGFGVAVSNREAGRAVLVAPGATTHGADMNQRIVNLQTIDDVPGKGLDVRAPASSDVAPPGYYMLFVLDKTGTPSVARWVRLGADAAVPPLLPPPTPAPVATAAPTATPTAVPTATPEPTTKPAPRRPQLRLVRHGRRLQLRLTFHAAGRAALEARLAGRRIQRTLRFKAAGTRSVTITAPRRATRLMVSVRATAASGRKWTLKDRWRVR
jgi:hypothetical protein